MRFLNIGNYCFSVYYYMYGIDFGILSFKVFQYGYSYIFKLFRGDFGNYWNYVRMEISIYYYFQVSINGWNIVIQLFVLFVF